MAYKISVEASRDIENIWLYTVENWSIVQADRYTNLIFDEIEYLANDPLSGKDISFIRQNYRSSKVKSHVIFYRVMEPKRISRLFAYCASKWIFQIYRTIERIGNDANISVG